MRNLDFRKRVTPADQARDLLARGCPTHVIRDVTGLSIQTILSIQHQPADREKTRPRSATFRPDRYIEPEPMPEPKSYRERTP